MPLATALCRAGLGITAPQVTVEVHLANGLPAFQIVGLAEKAVQESRERVRSALINCGFEFPARRITVNLAPADLPKEGGRFDLPIALGILAAAGALPTDEIAGAEFYGELTLAGAVQPVSGLLPAVLAAREAGHDLFLPAANLSEASLAGHPRLFAVKHLLEITAHFGPGPRLTPAAPEPAEAAEPAPLPDLAEVRGQAQAKRALVVAAAGGHNLLFSGPPGSGKSMLASRLPGLLPPLSEAQALECATLYSVAGVPREPAQWRRPPFRNPHHSCSAVALVGGGSHPRPGEISLAHNGVLFLDELPEFARPVLEVLREPLETGRVAISRAAGKAEFPARFQLVAAMNPCPCGHLGDPTRACRCTAEQVARYRGRLSGPLLDRIDLLVEVPTQPPEVLLAPDRPTERTSAELRLEVEAARARQYQRQGMLNARLPPAALEEHARLDAAGRALVSRAMNALGLSARAYHRILRVARTIADLEGAEAVNPTHLSEALGYRRLETEAPAVTGRAGSRR